MYIYYVYKHIYVCVYTYTHVYIILSPFSIALMYTCLWPNTWDWIVYQGLILGENWYFLSVATNFMWLLI